MRCLLAAALFGGCLPCVLSAQRIQPEMRVDVVGPRPYSVQPGIGATLALGYYARVGAAVGYGTRREGDASVREWRGDLLARVTLDPFRQHRWGLSLGGGLSFRRRAYLAALADIEGPELKGILPAVQFGFGGGLRAGLVLRRAMEGRR